jgi:hypothetical protein
MSYLGKIRSEYLSSPVPPEARSKRDASQQPIRAHIVHGATPKPAAPISADPELPKDNGLNGGGFQVLIQTEDTRGADILSREGLLRHVAIMEEIAQYTIDAFGETWTLADICFRPPSPPAPPKVPFADVFTKILDKIIPCIWITPADCFWEGSKALGPFPPIVLDLPAELIKSLPRGNLTWKNLDPQALLEEASTLLPGLDPLKNLFERAGIGHAYQTDRPCIDPLDVECPHTSPNYFDRCEALKLFPTQHRRLPTDTAQINSRRDSTCMPGQPGCAAKKFVTTGPPRVQPASSGLSRSRTR